MPTNKNSKPSATVLYHFFHPDDVISAQHFSQFSEELLRRGWDVTVLTSNRYCRYPNKKILQKKEWWKNILIIRIGRPRWNQANNYFRLLNSIWMMAGWILKLLRMPPADTVIVGTDPQFSALIFPLLRLFGRGKVLVHWCYDLYPEAIIADGATGILKRLAEKFSFLMRFAYRSIDIMVDIGECMRKRLNTYNHRARCATLIPWALVEPEQIKEPDASVRSELFGDATLTLLYSGNMGKAHDFSLFLELARGLYKKDPRIVMCFACRGNRVKELTSAVRPTDRNIRFAPFAKESELGKRLNAADIHLLSLREEWEGIVVPSKFFGSLAVGKPVIYTGPDGSAIAGWIKEFNVGLILKRENREEIINQLLEISHKPDKLLIWQRNAFQAYYNFFSKKCVMDQWDMLLREAIYIESPNRV